MMKCGSKTRTKHGKIYLMVTLYFGLGREHLGSFPRLERAILFQKGKAMWKSCNASGSNSTSNSMYGKMQEYLGLRSVTFSTKAKSSGALRIVQKILKA